MIDMQTFTVTLPDGSQVSPVGGKLTIDNGWSPYCQGTVVISSTGVNLASLDPRGNQPAHIAAARIKVDAIQQYADTQSFSDLSARFGAGTFAALSAAYGAGTFAAISNDVTHDRWGNPAKQWVRRRFDLAVIKRPLTQDGLITITVSSDETYAHDKISPTILYGGGYSPSFGLHTLRDLLTTLRFPLALSPSNFDFDLFPVLGNNAQPLTVDTSSIWDTVQTFVTLAAAMLWCDEARVWHLESNAVIPDGQIVHDSTTMVDFIDDLARDSDWYNEVYISYAWTDAAGVAHAQQDSFIVGLMDFTYPNRVLVIEKTSPHLPGFAAANLATRLQTYGHDVNLGAVNDFTAQPGQALQVTTPAGTFNGNVGSVVWDLETKEMSITARNLA